MGGFWGFGVLGFWGEVARKMRKCRFPPFGSVFTELELWEAFMRQFLAFLILGDIVRKVRKGRFPPFGSVFTEFELWEAFMRQFLAFLILGEIARRILPCILATVRYTCIEIARSACVFVCMVCTCQFKASADLGFCPLDWFRQLSTWALGVIKMSILPMLISQVEYSSASQPW